MQLADLYALFTTDIRLELPDEVSVCQYSGTLATTSAATATTSTATTASNSAASSGSSGYNTDAMSDSASESSSYSASGSESSGMSGGRKRRRGPSCKQSSPSPSGKGKHSSPLGKRVCRHSKVDCDEVTSRFRPLPVPNQRVEL